MIDGRSQIGFAIPVGRDKSAALELHLHPEYGCRLICVQDFPARFLALAYPGHQKAEACAIDRRKSNVRPSEQPNTRDALNLSPFMGKTEHPAKVGRPDDCDAKNQSCEEGRGLRMRLVMLLTMGS